MPPPITRLYCPTCAAKYRYSYGALLEVILHGVTYYWTATLPDVPDGEPYGMLGAFFHAALADPSILPSNWTMTWGPLIKQRQEDATAATQPSPIDRSID